MTAFRVTERAWEQVSKTNNDDVILVIFPPLDSELVASWQMFAESMKALLATLQGFTTFMQVRGGAGALGVCSQGVCEVKGQLGAESQQYYRCSCLCLLPRHLDSMT